MGPLATIIQVAIALRLYISKILNAVGLRQYAPYPSYLQALSGGVKYDAVWKLLLRDTTIVTGMLCSAIFCLVRGLYLVYESNRYLFI